MSGGAADCSLVGINEVASNNAVSVYPNPSTGMFTIDADIPASAVQVYSLNGGLVKNINAQNNGGVVSFDLSGADNGTYVVNVVSNDIQFTERIMLVK